MVSNIAIITGGKGSERDISIRSSESTRVALVGMGYQVSVYTFPEEQDQFFSEYSVYDFAFVMIHGEDGEDGRVPALLELLDIPFAGSPSQAHALCIDKARTKQIWRDRGLPVANEYIGDIGNFDLFQIESVINNVGGYPVVIKSLTEGSSQGVYIIMDHDDLLAHYPSIKQHHQDMMIECYIEGREFTVAVLENTDGIIQALPVVEIIPPEGQQFDYENKYNGSTDEICPAKIDTILTQQLQDLALKAHKSTGCSGYSRTDIMLGSSGPVLLEINTIPGFTDQSLFPLAAKSNAISFSELLNIMIQTGQNKKTS
ncbi:MAG: D-alanine--D-alanine ligase [Patescibacteria group bacterium]|nr:D-alanine--D-alanine ligase [Patescibacteria group bacterium]